VDPNAERLPGFFNIRGRGNLQISINTMSTNDGLDVEVQVALKDALKILIELASEPGIELPLGFNPVPNRSPLTVK
jgi:hypothetical protein